MTHPPSNDGERLLAEHQSDDLSPLILFKRLVEESGSAPSAALAADALRQAELEIPGEWSAVWQDRIRTAGAELGLQVQGLWLSPEEVAATLRPGQPALTYRPVPENPGGWTLLVDRRWGKVFRAEVDGEQRDRWEDLKELSAKLGSSPVQRIPWLICDPAVAPLPKDGAHDHAMTPQRRLLQMVRPDRSDVWSIVVFGLLVAALTLATPIAVQQLVNSVALGGLMQPVVVLALLLFFGLSFSAVLSALQAYVAEIVQRRIFVRVVADLSHRLPRVQLEAFDSQHGPELVNRFFDVMTVQKVGATLLLDGVGLMLQTIIGLLVLSFYHPLMLAFSVLLLFGIAIVVFVVGRGAVSTAIAESKSKYAMAGWLEEMARNAAELKSAGGARFAADRADALAHQYLEARTTHYRVVFRQLSGALGMQVFASSALLGLGGGLVIMGQLTLGQLVASELIVTAIVAAFAKLGKHMEGYYDLLAAVDKLGHLFDLPLERMDGEVYEPAGAGASLSFHEVDYAYGRTKVVDGLSFVIAPKERVALVGPIGSGKSTVLDIAIGFRTPNSGYVTLDGIDLRELRLETVRDEVVMVGRHEMIEATIEDNVRLGRAHVSSRAIRTALEEVGLLEEIRQLPDGIATMLSNGGAPLSDGQIIRITLARAIAARPHLILLDESLLDLDDRSRRKVFDTLFDPEAPWTLVVTAVTDEIEERCDRVIRLAGASGSNPPPTEVRSTEVEGPTDGI
jgi:putative ABC transport system ATP-binding protein